VDKVIDDPANQVIVLCKFALRGREKLALHWVNNGDTHRVWNQNKKGLQFKSTELPQGRIVSSDVSAVTVPETLNIALRFERHTSDTAVTITFGFAEEQVASANA
jgi:hypothetical protein